MNNLTSAVFLLALVGSGAVPNAVDAVGGPWPIGVVVAVGTLVAFRALIDVPFDRWKWRHERDFGLTPTTAAQFARDQVVDSLTNIGVFSAMFVPMWAVIRATDRWWLLAWAVFAIGVIVLNGVGPVLLSPISNRFTRLDDPALERRLVAFSREAGVRVAAVYVMDASRRTTVHNAYVAGFGRWRRIVVFDTLLTGPPEVIEFVLAHEIGHLRRHHVFKNVTLLLLSLLPGFWLIGTVVSWEPMLRFAGIASPRHPGALVVLLPVLTVAMWGVRAISAALSRFHERQADLDALEFTRDADAGDATFRSANEHGIGNLEPGWLARIQMSHPLFHERLEFVSQWRSARNVGLVFTDIVDSTPMVQRLGDRRWFDLLREHDELVRTHVAARGGAVADHTGDGFLLVFDDAGSAVLCAVEIQRALSAARDCGALSEPIAVRMGVHAGEVVRQGANVFGREVHLAARVASAASGQEILVTAGVRDSLHASQRFTFDDAGVMDFKGFEGGFRTYRAEWRVAEIAELATVS